MNAGDCSRLMPVAHQISHETPEARWTMRLKHRLAQEGDTA
jgi:hypothetical protein